MSCINKSILKNHINNKLISISQTPTSQAFTNLPANGLLALAGRLAVVVLGCDLLELDRSAARAQDLGVVVPERDEQRLRRALVALAQLLLHVRFELGVEAGRRLTNPTAD